MKKYILIFSMIGLLMGACTDQLREDQLVQAEDVDRLTAPRYLLAGALTETASFYQKEGFSSDERNAIMEYYQQLFSVKSQLYEEFAKAPESWDTEFKILYLIKSGIDESEEAPATGAALKVLHSFMFAYMTDQFGDIPYSEALSGRDGIVRPAYDMQEDIYVGLLSTLDEAISTLSSTSDAIDASHDLLYSGSKDSWIRFANSLKIRLLVRSYDAFGGSKKAELQAAANANIISDNMYNAAVAYEGSTSANSWPHGFHQDNSGSNLSRRKPSVTFINMLRENNDPRLQAWIAPAIKPWATDPVDHVVTDIYGYTYSVQPRDVATFDGDLTGYALDETYIGVPVGKDNLPTIYGDSGDDGGGNYENYKVSSFSNIFLENSHALIKATMMEASEVSFCLAEAAEKGWITGDASEYYERGIQQNMDRWEIDSDLVDAYIAANPLTDEKLRKIGTQKWLSLFTNGIESYMNYRRTGFPIEIGNLPVTVTQNFPKRTRYPTLEADNNTEQYDIAVSRLGVDDQNSKIWLIK